VNQKRVAGPQPKLAKVSRQAGARARLMRFLNRSRFAHVLLLLAVPCSWVAHLRAEELNAGEVIAGLLELTRWASYGVYRLGRT
jgi:hypothetical protein